MGQYYLEFFSTKNLKFIFRHTYYMFLNHAQIITLQERRASSSSPDSRLSCRPSVEGNIATSYTKVQACRYARSNVSARRSMDSTSSACSSPFFGIRHFSSSKTYHGRYFCRLIDWVGNRTQIRQYPSAHYPSNSGRLQVRSNLFGMLRPRSFCRANEGRASSKDTGPLGLGPITKPKLATGV